MDRQKSKQAERQRDQRQNGVRADSFPQQGFGHVPSNKIAAMGVAAVNALRMIHHSEFSRKNPGDGFEHADPVIALKRLFFDSGVRRGQQFDFVFPEITALNGNVTALVLRDFFHRPVGHGR